MTCGITSRKGSVEYKAGQVVLVKFHPGRGSEIKRYRPSIIVADIPKNSDKRFVLISPLTSQPPQNENPLEIRLSGIPFLKKESYTLLWYLRTVDVRRVQTVLGSLPAKDLKNIQRRIQKMFK